MSIELVVVWNPALDAAAHRARQQPVERRREYSKNLHVPSRVFEHLKRHGAATLEGLAEVLNVDPHNINSALYSLRDRGLVVHEPSVTRNSRGMYCGLWIAKRKGDRA